MLHSLPLPRIFPSPPYHNHSPRFNIMITQLYIKENKQNRIHVKSHNGQKLIFCIFLPMFASMHALHSIQRKTTKTVDLNSTCVLRFTKCWVFFYSNWYMQHAENLTAGIPGWLILNTHIHSLLQDG